MIKKFMVATSVAALIAGAASAQLLLEDTGGGTVALGDIIAEEVDFTAMNASGNGDGDVELEVVTQGTIPPGQNLFLTIDVTNGSFHTALDGSEFNSGTTGAVVDTGGGVGASSVRYLITSNTGNDGSASGNGADSVNLTLPINMDSCGDLTFSVSEFETESGGTDIEGGSANLTDSTGAVEPLVTCEDVFVASVVDDSITTTTPAFTGTPSVLTLASSFADFAAVGPDSAPTARLGEFRFDITSGGLIDLIGTLAIPAHVEGFTATVDFAGDDSEIVSSDAAATVGTMFAAGPAASGAALTSTTAPTLTSETGDLTVTITNANPVEAQSVSVSAASLDLDTAVFLQATDPFVAADAEDLKLEGQIFGPFDWVSDSTKLVNTIFRVTGLDPTVDVPAQIVVANSRNGAAFNGVYPTTILGSSVQGSEIRLNSAALEAVAGQFGTADISLVFSSNEDLDVDRLLAGPSTAVVVPFGDGANQDGVGAAGSTTSPGTGVNDDTGNY